MTQSRTKGRGRREEKGEAFSSNAVRLSLGEWAAVGAVLTVMLLFVGDVWRKLEPFQPASDYRIPYELSEDYWLVQRFCERVTGGEKTLVLGDSFVWGQYVAADETLTHFLNQEAGSSRFVNLGVDGAHPLAMEGLIRHHCPGLSDTRILLHLNLLWMSSPQSDLHAQGEVRFNHPRLIPQLLRRIPSYQASLSERIGALVSRSLPAMTWSRHLQVAYFGHADLPGWTLENPYSNPLQGVTLALPDPSGARYSDPQPWSAEGDTRRTLPWVPLRESLQWAAFQRIVRELRSRRNHLSVLIGPLNEHMLTDRNAAVYRGLLSEARNWLDREGIPHLVPDPLSSEEYADLSHPLHATGYAYLAREMWTAMTEWTLE
jgi:hypothetical protein